MSQLGLFEEQSTVNRLPKIPTYLKSSVFSVIKHTNDILVYREQKPVEAPSCVHFFTGDMAGRGMEITPELEQALIKTIQADF